MIKNTLLISSLQIISAFALNASPEIVAQRGASHQAPENTLPDFELVWEQ